MPLLNLADKVYRGTSAVSSVYAGPTKVWGLPVPTVKGYANAVSAGSPTVVNPATNLVGTPISTGDWMILVWGYSAASSLRTPILMGPWHEKVASLGVGTMGWGLWTGTRQAGDTTYSVTLNAGSNVPNWMMVWGSGAKPDTAWVLGAIGNRAQAGNQFDVIAPSITVPPNSLVLAVGAERTTASETLAQIGIDNGFTKYAMVNPTSCAPFLAYRNRPGSGGVGATKATWPNAHASNGQLMLIGIPAS